MPIAVYKPPSWTPLEAIDALRVLRPELGSAVMGYAGRLDPMAEGVVLVLLADENKSRASFQQLDKRYRVRVLFGVATDTMDALGLPERVGPRDDLDRERLLPLVSRIEGSFRQSVPVYASVRVRGRPMFHWARRGMAEQMERPSYVRTIHSARLDSVDRVASGEVVEGIVQRVQEVRGDFRQAAIVERWRSVGADLASRTLTTATIDVACSSGTFMRSVASGLGDALGVPSLALEIVRTAVGEFSSDQAVRLGHRG